MKKLILPILLTSAFLSTLLILPGIAMAFFHDKGSESELDCYDTAVEATKDPNKSKVAQWGDRAGGQLYYDSSPKTISKNQGENYCLLTKTQKVEEVIDDEYVLKITYSPELPSLSNKFNELKSSEESDFEIKENSENEYSGRTARGDPYRENIQNYARKVNILGNCLIEFTYRASKTPAMHDDMGFAKILADAQLEGLKNYHATIVSSEKLQSFCGEKAPANSSSNQKIQQTKPRQSQPNQDITLTADQDKVRLPVFIGEWFSLVAAGTDLLVKSAIFEHELIDAFKVEEPESTTFETLIRLEAKERRFAELKKQSDKSNNPNNPEDAVLETSEKPIPIKKDSAQIQLSPNGEEKGLLEMGDMPVLRSGQIDVIVEPQEGKHFKIQTPNAEILVIGTEFSVIHSQKENKTLAAVYKGKVEVKTKDGQTTIVTPNDDKPGAVVVAQKLSVTKLLIVAAVASTMVFGLYWFFKKRGFTRKKRF